MNLVPGLTINLTMNLANERTNDALTAGHDELSMKGLMLHLV